MHWTPEKFELIADGTTWVIDASTTVWWRRPGYFQNSALPEPELDLARDELAIIAPGAFESTGARWVDSPWTVERARNRLVQLQTASSMGIPAPATAATNVSGHAEAMVRASETVAKTISIGPGLAPFVDSLGEGDCDFVSSSPVVLQHRVKAVADWRIVTVDGDSFAWRRTRQLDDPVDWRSVDPEGSGFESAELPDDIRRHCAAICAELQLTFGVQDWVEGSEGFAFLEVNPQGQWMFLSGASGSLAKAVAQHLLPDRDVALDATTTRPPGAFRQFWWDLLPAASPDWLVPRQSGLVVPVINTAWITKPLAERPEALAVTQRVHDQERSSISSLEAKASSITRLCLTFLALVLGLLSFQISFVRGEDAAVSWLFLIPSLGAIGLLIATVVTSLEMQRVGLYQSHGVEEIRLNAGSLLDLVRAEERNRRMAGVTRSRKANQFLQVRAWLSRSLIASLLAALVSVAMFSLPDSPDTPAEAPPADPDAQND